jgi:hypothetical protein
LAAPSASIAELFAAPPASITESFAAPLATIAEPIAAPPASVAELFAPPSASTAEPFAAAAPLHNTGTCKAKFSEESYPAPSSPDSKARSEAKSRC